MEKEEKKSDEKITFSINKEKNFSEWFSEVLQKAELVDIRYNVKGFEVFMPFAAIMMEEMYKLFEDALRKSGHMPCIFPALIPEENFKKEKEHVKEFEPDVFWVENAREGRLALRPTSETAFYQLYSLWIRSYKDLPLKLYQRANVWRNETKATRPLIRTREIYWIETHDCFSTQKEAEKQVQDDIRTTEEIMHQKLGIPFLPLRRPEWDKFPGAVYTIGSDSLMPDGRVIQQPSTHFLGQGFSQVFDIKFKAEDGKEQFVWQTCYGPAVSRILASIIAVHGDDNGLVLPFIIAPIQIVIIPILKQENKKSVLDYCKKSEERLSGFRVKLDSSESTPGEKFYYWETRGIPLRIEVGEQEIKKKELTIFLRDIKKRIKVKESDLLKTLSKEGNAFDEGLRQKADKWFKDRIVDAKTKDDLKKIIDDKKVARVNFCSLNREGEKCAEYIEKQLLASVRGARADKQETANGSCIICGKKASAVVYIAKSY